MDAERSLKWYKKLQEINMRRDSGYFMVEGLNAVNQVCAVAPSAIIEILYTEEVPLQLSKYQTRFVRPAKLAEILTSKTPQGIAALVKAPQDIYDPLLPTKLGSKVLLLDGVSNPGNTGTLIRSASALSFDGVVLTVDGCDVLAPKVVAASAGALFSLWLKRVFDVSWTINYFKQNGFTVVGTALKGQNDSSVLKAEKLLLVLGNEARGLSPQTIASCDYTLCLPIDNTKAESLNVATAGSICMYLANH